MYSYPLFKAVIWNRSVRNFSLDVFVSWMAYIITLMLFTRYEIHTVPSFWAKQDKEIIWEKV